MEIHFTSIECHLTEGGGHLVGTFDHSFVPLFTHTGAVDLPALME